MIKTEKKFTDKDIENLALRFRILSEPSRLKILSLLFDGEMCVGDIIESSGLLQSNVSKQLKILQSNGILECRQQGLKRYYRVSDFTVLKICNLLCTTDEFI